MSKCPECKTPIEKSEGCNFMTCAICKTSFSILSGLRDTHGSHNKDVKLNSLDKYKLSIQFKDKYSAEIIEKIIELEKNEPKKYNTINIAKNINIESNKYIAKEYSKYRNNENLIIKYFQKLSEIHKLAIDGKLNIKHL